MWLPVTFSPLCCIPAILDCSGRRGGFGGVSALASVGSAVVVKNVVGLGGWRGSRSKTLLFTSCGALVYYRCMLTAGKLTLSRVGVPNPNDAKMRQWF